VIAKPVIGCQVLERASDAPPAAWPDLEARKPLAHMPTHTFMELALDEAHAAAEAGEVPIGCVITCDGDLIAQAGNRTLAERDPTAHAEMVAIRRAAAALGSERLSDCDLYVTLEPCTMCAAAISFARIRRLYYGAADPKGGAVESGVRFFSAPTCLHRPEVYGGIGETEAAELLQAFFRARR
jgi:tRNA(adenine34) deaminase